MQTTDTFICSIIKQILKILVLILSWNLTLHTPIFSLHNLVKQRERNSWFMIFVGSILLCFSEERWLGVGRRGMSWDVFKVFFEGGILTLFICKS